MSDYKRPAGVGILLSITESLNRAAAASAVMLTVVVLFPKLSTWFGLEINRVLTAADFMAIAALIVGLRDV